VYIKFPKKANIIKSSIKISIQNIPYVNNVLPEIIDLITNSSNTEQKIEIIEEVLKKNLSDKEAKYIFGEEDKTKLYDFIDSEFQNKNKSVKHVCRTILNNWDYKYSKSFELMTKEYQLRTLNILIMEVKKYYTHGYRKIINIVYNYLGNYKVEYYPYFLANILYHTSDLLDSTANSLLATSLRLECLYLMLKYNIENLDYIDNNGKLYDWWQIPLEQVAIHIIQNFISSKSYQPAYELLNFIINKYPNNIEIYYFKGYLLNLLCEYKNSEIAYDIFKTKVKDIKPSDSKYNYYHQLMSRLHNKTLERNI